MLLNTTIMSYVQTSCRASLKTAFAGCGQGHCRMPAGLSRMRCHVGTAAEKQANQWS